MSNLGLFEPSDPTGSSNKKPSYIQSLIVKNLLAILCLSFVVALFAYIRVKTGLLGGIDPAYSVFAPAMGLALLNWFLVRKEIKCFNESVHYLLVFVVCISSFFVYFFFDDYVVFRLATFTQVDTITSENLEEIKGYNFIELKYVDIDATKCGSTTMVNNHGRNPTKDVYQVCQINGMPHVYLGTSQKGKKLQKTPLYHIVVRHVTDDYTYHIYNEAVRQCESVHPLIKQVDCCVFELSSDYTQGAKIPLRILITLLIGNLLIYIICKFAGPKWIYEIERDNREPVYSDSLFTLGYVLQPNFIPYYIIFVVCIVVLFLEIIGGYGAGAQNLEVVDRLGGASYSRVFQQHEYWRVIAANFIHGGVKHLLGNLFSFVLAVFICKVYAGDRKITDFLLSCVFMLGGIVSMLLVPYFQHSVILCGASAGVFAMFGFAMWYGLVSLANFEMDWRLLCPLLSFLVINLLYSLLPRVSLLGHVIGFITGLLCAAVYHLLNPRPKSRW